jgi:hypothetical protein
LSTLWAGSSGTMLSDGQDMHASRGAWRSTAEVGAAPLDLALDAGLAHATSRVQACTCPGPETGAQTDGSAPSFPDVRPRRW